MKVLLFSCFFYFIIAYSWGGDLPTGFTEQVLVEGIDPVDMALLSDGRILIAEKNGTILLFKNGSLSANPVLQISVINADEHGLKNIVPDPDFDLNGYLYVFYTTRNPETNKDFNRVSRFKMDGDEGVAGSETVLLDLDTLYASYHDGGSLGFGPDGNLYIGTGDTGVSEFSQSLTSLHGKILRINKDGSIPEDNPFYQSLEGKYRAIFAYGFRNPFGMDVDPVSGAILVTEVGSDRYEELNLLEPGKDYGWPRFEGPKQDGQNSEENYKDPFFFYQYATEGRCAIVGAAFYNPAITAFPAEYHNKFFFADYCSGSIYYLNPQTGVAEGILATNVNRLVSMGVDFNGDLLYLQRAGLGDGSFEDNTSTTNGALIRISYNGGGMPFVSRNLENKIIPAGEDVQFELLASGNQPLSFQWFKNGEPVGDNSNKLSLSAVDLSLNNSEIYCTITNDEGSLTTNSAVLSVLDDTKPVANIQFPDESFYYSGGDTIKFSGVGEDKEDGILEGTSLNWKIDFHHGTHTHPAVLSHLGNSGTYVVPFIGETSDNVWYRIYLTATDKNGFSKRVYHDVFPNKSTVLVKTEPEGFDMTLEGKMFVGDTSFVSVAGLQRSVHTNLIQKRGEKLFAFDGWGKDGNDPDFYFKVSLNDTTITAHFSEVVFSEGEGLKISYFDDHEKFLNNLPDSTSIGNINFDWGLQSPKGMPVNNFFIRSEGFLVPFVSGSHHFTVESSDGIRLWVNNEQLIDDWENNQSKSSSGSIYLEKGEYYPVNLEHFDASDEASVKLQWSMSGFEKEVILQSQLASIMITPEEPELELEQEQEDGSVVTGTLNSVSSDNFKVFPNPFLGSFHLSVSENINQKIQKIEVLNLNGKTIFLFDKNETGEYDISTERLPKSIYVLRCFTSDGAYQVKLVKN